MEYAGLATIVAGPLEWPHNTELPQNGHFCRQVAHIKEISDLEDRSKGPATIVAGPFDGRRASTRGEFSALLNVSILVSSGIIEYRADEKLDTSLFAPILLFALSCIVCKWGAVVVTCSVLDFIPLLTLPTQNRRLLV